MTGTCNSSSEQQHPGENHRRKIQTGQRVTGSKKKRFKNVDRNNPTCRAMWALLSQPDVSIGGMSGTQQDYVDVGSSGGKQLMAVARVTCIVPFPHYLNAMWRDRE